MDKSPSSSVDRVVRLLDALSSAAAEGAGLTEIATEAGLAVATAHRMLADLESVDLVYRSSDKRYFPNFTFDRQIALDANLLDRARRSAGQLSAALNIASEIVFRRGPNLVWHAKIEPADQSIRLRAHAGFVRSAHELDAISRLALAQLGSREITSIWDPSRFYETGVEARRLTWEEARARIEAVDPDGPAYDMRGNSKGVRRFAICVRDRTGAFACLLTAVEAAIPVRDEETHRQRILDALVRTRDEIESRPQMAGETTPALLMGGVK